MNPKHVEVYFEPGRYAGWPANHGIWIWENEILVGFLRGYYKDRGPDGGHHIDRERPKEPCLARSLDGGESWTLERPNEQGFLMPYGSEMCAPGFEHPPTDPPGPCPGGIDFQHPDFALAFQMSNSSGSAGPARMSYSYDRGRTWTGPYLVPDFDTPGISARTDYIVTSPSEALVFLTAAKSNAEEGRPFCARLGEGGKRWEFLSWIGPEPEGFAIMPSTVALSPEALLCTLRCREGSRRWLRAYRSDDAGKTWQHLNDPIDDLGSGNPPALVRLADGRLCITYGWRGERSRMGAKISEDEGRTWSPEIVLRDDGDGEDMGYSRTVQRPDGALVTVYYYTAPNRPERFIAATLWEAP